MRKLLIRLILLFRYPLLKIRRNSISFYSIIGPNVLLANCRVGRYNYIGRNSVLNNTDILNYCSIAPGVQIGGMEHSYWWYSNSTFLSDYCVSNKKTKIENDVWIAANAIIKQGVTIGTGAVIGAGAFVNFDVPPYAIIVGVPGKILKYRFPEEIREKLLKTKYWALEPNEAIKVLNELSEKL